MARHCERHKWREAIQSEAPLWIASSLSLLAMTRALTRAARTWRDDFLVRHAIYPPPAVFFAAAASSSFFFCAASLPSVPFFARPAFCSKCGKDRC